MGSGLRMVSTHEDERDLSGLRSCQLCCLDVEDRQGLRDPFQIRRGSIGSRALPQCPSRRGPLVLDRLACIVDNTKAILNQNGSFSSVRNVRGAVSNKDGFGRNFPLYFRFLRFSGPRRQVGQSKSSI